MVHAVCKQTVNYKGGEVPDGSKDAELHAGQKECEWISWTRCCKLSFYILTLNYSLQSSCHDLLITELNS